MTTVKTISVIIAVHNAEPYLQASIESVLKQRWPHKELIIVDDGSTDRSFEIAKEAECKWIKVYRLASNCGQSYASNFGYEKSSGELIKFLDADDLMDDNYLETMLSNYRDCDSLYFSHCINFTENYEKPYPIENWVCMSPLPFLLSPRSYMRQGGRWVIPRKIIEKAGLWNERLSLINDFEYFNRLSLASQNIYYVKEAILYYRQVSGSVSSERSLSSFESAFNAIKLSSDVLFVHEYSERTKKYIANSFKGLLYSIYPLYPQLTTKIESEIQLLGGSDKPFDAGGKTLLLSRLTNWKFAKLILHHFMKITGKMK